MIKKVINAQVTGVIDIAKKKLNSNNATLSG